MNSSKTPWTFVKEEGTDIEGLFMPSKFNATELANIVVAIVFIVATSGLGYKFIGLPPVVIVGGAGLIALLVWSATYLKRPVSAEIILPWFLLTVAALEIHMMEEYLTKFGPAMSRLFNITWTERSFLMVFAFIGPALYALTAIGLAWRECPYYTERERAALAWAEAVTLVTNGHVPDTIYEQTRQQFSEKELSDLTFAVATINAWNRLSIAGHTVPGTYKSLKEAGEIKTSA
jgi:hypothetical protein